MRSADAAFCSGRIGAAAITSTACCPSSEANPFTHPSTPDLQLVFSVLKTGMSLPPFSPAVLLYRCTTVQAVGFVHGVLNTDNMSILGLTIDYGPYGEPGPCCIQVLKCGSSNLQALEKPQTTQGRLDPH